MAYQIAQVSFHGHHLSTIKQSETVFAVMRPIVEGIGLDWKSQSVKLNQQKEKFNCGVITTVAGDGKDREMLCIPLRKLNGWLFTINPEKVKPEIRERVIQYQEECFEVLHDYWHSLQSKEKAESFTRPPFQFSFPMRTFYQENRWETELSRYKSFNTSNNINSAINEFQPSPLADLLTQLTLAGHDVTGCLLELEMKNTILKGLQKEFHNMESAFRRMREVEFIHRFNPLQLKE